jgi:hypothetical protein
VTDNSEPESAPESAHGEGEQDSHSKGLDMPMEDETDQQAATTEEDRPGLSGRDSVAWSESHEVSSSLLLPPPLPVLGGNYDVHTSDKDPSLSKKPTGVNQK